MSSRPAPAWLGEFQARFGSVLRTPLDRTTGTLRAMTSEYDPEIGASDGPRALAHERLAVYNRQYWFRLYGVFQTAFPLVTRLFGHWLFNDYAARFLIAHPPSHWDIDHVTTGFETWLPRAIEQPSVRVGRSERVVERDALVEAAQIDAAWRRVFLAPSTHPYRPSAEDAARLLRSRLTPSTGVAVIEEHWPLLELRRSLSRETGEAPVPLPLALSAVRFWALVQRPEGIGQVSLEAREAELFRLLEKHVVEDALARLEAACSDAERVDLPARARAWLARSVELDFWTGIETAD